MLEAQERGYISVGLHVDSEDWQRPGVAAIVHNVISSIASAPSTCDNQADAQCSRNVVLLHDSGGDRRQTIAALPIIIDTLRADGYQFVPVSELAGLSPSQAMPPLSPADHAAAVIDLAVFQLLGLSIRLLGFLFGVAITLGIARALLLSSLALASAARERRNAAPAQHPGTFVSVLIPAFNEEAVIERCITRVLSSEEVKLEVIVIDDGSKDRTAEVVERVFGGEGRVRLVRLENGGKARALNQGLAFAQERHRGCARRRHAVRASYDRPPGALAGRRSGLAAVAGNAKVGNRVNIVTYWQALEYVTAQNVERRALAWLGAMTVVPGAVGAWRKQAILDVGGYPPDTLAEDQDLTIAVQRAGWRVAYDQSAIAWTEAPQSVRQLARQRFRWAFGTIQCVWKHKKAIWAGTPRGLALIGLPQTILFQLRLRAHLADHRPRAHRQHRQHPHLDPRARLYVGQGRPPDGRDLLGPLRCDRSHRRADRDGAGAARGLAADVLADPAARRLPADHVLCRDQGPGPGGEGAAGRLVFNRPFRRGPFEHEERRGKVGIEAPRQAR